ncbi:hypothetical protein GCM10022270_03150 [Terriglobus aquaticus]
MVLLSRLQLDRVGGGAGRAFQIFEDDHGDTLAGGRLQHARVFEVAVAGGPQNLGVGGGKRKAERPGNKRSGKTTVHADSRPANKHVAASSDSRRSRVPVVRARRHGFRSEIRNRLSPAGIQSER